MFCNKCGNQNDLDSKFCTKCGNKIEQNKIDPQDIVKINSNNKEKKKSIIKIVLKAIAIVSIIIIINIIMRALPVFILMNGIISGGENWKKKNNPRIMHTKEEMLYSIDNLDCSEYDYSGTINFNKSSLEKGITINPLLNCNIKNGYTVLKETTEMPEENIYYKIPPIEMKVIYLRLNDYDIEFSVRSSVQCTKTFSASCYGTEYLISTDYQTKATKYFLKKYVEEKNITFNNISNYTNSFYPFYTVKDKDDIANATIFINDFVNYINSFNIRFLPASYNEYSLEIWFISNVELSEQWRYSAKLKLSLIDGKYVLRGSKDYTSDGELVNISDLNEYLLKHAQYNEVF